MLRKVYYRTKALVDEGFKRAVWLAYALEDRIAGSQNVRLKRASQALSSYAGNISDLAAHFPRLDVTHITDDAHSIIYVGDMDISAKYMLNALLPDGYDEAPLGRVPVWRLPALNREWLTSDVIVIARVSRAFPWPLRARYRFSSPVNVNHVLDVAGRTLGDLLAGGENKRLRKMVNGARKVGYRFRISDTEPDLRFFYERMYVPLIENRHGELSHLLTYDACEQIVQDGGYLIFVQLDGQDILADLVQPKNGMLYDFLVGVLDGDVALMADGQIFHASYYNVIEHAIAQGLQSVNFDNTNAWVTDGLYAYKQRWGTHPYPPRHIFDHFVFLADSISPDWAERFNRVGFISHRGQQYLRVYIDDIAQPERKCADAHKQGLDGVLIVTPNGQTIFNKCI